MAETLFFDSAGWGLQSDILEQRNRDKDVVEEIPVLRDLYKGKLVYAGAILDRFIASYAEPTKFRATVTADGRTLVFDRLTDLVIKATAVYGGSWVLDRFGEPDDGKFELIPIQGRRDWASKALRDLATVPIWQEHLDLVGITHLEGLSAQSFQITFERESGHQPVPAQVDGEEWMSGLHFEVEVLANTLDVITPEGFVPPWKIDRV